MVKLHEIKKVIDKIKFSIFSPETIRKMSAAKITVPDTYDDDGYPIDGGLLDLRLGVVDPGLRCKTCGGKVNECPGHFGHIELVRPVVHPSFAKYIYLILRSVCPTCKKIIFSNLDNLKDEEKIEKKEIKVCPHCKSELPVFKFVKPTTFFKNDEEMLPSDIKEILSGISDEDIIKLGFDPVYARPEWMILTVLPVPPVTMRPSITLEMGERSEDDLTHKLVDIIRINQKLEANINAGAPQLIIEDLWQLLQYHVTTYFDNSSPNIPPARHRSGRPLKTLAQRLKGKEGRFRYNLSGKRVNFSARTVISPDPRISISEVGVPLAIASELTVPVRVTQFNIEECKSLILADSYPKALYVIRSDNRKIKITDQNKKEIAENLKVGYIIERQLKDGDIVIFNRQPSLHRISMMAHEVKVLPGKTFRLNPTVTPPYNADFDGDEMNLHVPQNVEAQAEAKILMKVENQILSPRHGHAIIKPQEDYVSGLYFLTKDDTTFSKSEAANLLYLAGIKELPKPDRGDRYSGKLIFSQLLPKGINIKVKSKLGEEIIIKNSLLIKGAIESKAIENDLLEFIFMHYGPEVTRNFLDNITRVALEVITKHGLSVSLRNYTLSEEAKKKIDERLDKMNREIESLILAYKNKTLQLSPGMGLKETLESTIMQVTTKAREDIGKIVEEDLGIQNSSILMAKIGARGSLLNAIQMSAAVMQQAVRNKRPLRGYSKRNLPFYEKGKLSARERGFVYGSFKKGLEPDEFYLHGMGGRESIVNTAIRTGRSGYMQRRLINALQDVIVYEDYTTRDSRGKIIQFIYGADGNDPMLASRAQFADVVKQDDVDTA